MLLDDWKSILRKAWSVRFMIAASLLSGLEVALPFMKEALEPLDVVKPGTFAVLAALTSAAAMVARVLAQPDKDKS